MSTDNEAFRHWLRTGAIPEWRQREIEAEAVRAALRAALDPLGRILSTHDEGSGKVVREAAPGEYVCDFCLAPDPTWTYPCGRVAVISTIIDASDDEWAACDRCHELIEAGDIEAMISHMISTQRGQSLADDWTVVPLAVHMAAQRHNVEAFLAARTGPAYRSDPRTGARLNYPKEDRWAT